jgi:hypothetical protein
MSSASLTALPQFTLQRESYLRLDGKKHILTGREHRRNRNQRDLLYKRVAFRLVFTCAVPSSEQLDNLKQAIDKLRLSGITTQLEDTTVFIMTDTRCSAGLQRIKRLKIWLYKQINNINLSDDSIEQSLVRCLPPDSSARAIRHGRQHNPRRLTPDVTIAADVTIVPEEIAVLATTLSQRVLTTCANHVDLDNLESELASGLLVAAG